MHSFPLLFVLLAKSVTIFAQTSLYVPGFDPQPLSADVLGVGPQGRTTWALHQGTPTGTSDDDSDFVGTATLVEGSDFASVRYVDPSGQFTIASACSLSGSLAVCTATSGTATETETETITRFAVQPGTTAPGAGATATPGTTSGATPGSSQTSTSPQPTGNSSAPKPTATSNAKISRPYLGTLLVFIAVVAVSI